MSETVRILHVSQPTDAGVPNVVLALVRDQVARGWDVHVACPTTSGYLAEDARKAGAQVHQWEAGRNPDHRVADEARRLRAIVKDTNPDVVHLHSAKAGLAGRLSIRGRTKTIYQPHAWSWEAVAGRTQAAAIRWEQSASRWTDLTLCVSDDELAAGRALGALGHRAVVIPNGVDLDQYSPRDRHSAREVYGIAEDVPLVVCVGRLARQKGQDVLLDAFEGISRRVPGAQLVLVGDGPDAEALKRRAPEGVVFAGAADADAVATWIACADVVAIPSRWEAGVSLAAMEALAGARSVVLTAVAGVRAAFSGSTAVVPVDDAEQMGDRVVERLLDPDLRRAEEEANRTMSRERFSVTSACEATAGQVLALLGRKGAEPVAGATRRRTVVVGGGMLGLRVAQRLSETSDVTILEGAAELGGLVSPATYETPRGAVQWDRFYHVVLSQDTRVLDLLNELGLSEQVEMKTVSSELLDRENRVHPMSSVLDLVRLPVLPLASRLRVGATVGAGALLPISAGAERTTAADWVRRWSGQTAWDRLWQPLLAAKLGDRADVAASTFLRATYRRLLVARLQGGTGDKFGWLDGGYPTVLEAFRRRLDESGVRVETSCAVTGIERRNAEWVVHTDRGEHTADDVIVTASGRAAADLTGGFSTRVKDGFEKAQFLGVVCVSVLLTKRVTGAYLTYVTADAPYTGIIEMTNLVDPAQLRGYHLIYLPRYISPTDPLFDVDDAGVTEQFVSDLVSRYPDLSPEDVVTTHVARARYVMPVPVEGWMEARPPHRVSPQGLYLASSAQVVDGTLNVDTTFGIADSVTAIIERDRARDHRRHTPTEGER